MKPRFILSYDMTFLAVVLNLDSHVNLDDRFLCYKRVNIQSHEEQWKRLAAMSLLLAAKKLEDDIADDDDLKAKIALKIFRKAFNKAEADYPLTASIFQNGFAKMTMLEKEQADVVALSTAFGELMTDAVSSLFTCSEEDIIVMRHVTQWVYFIDALDDLDKDINDGSYNPLKAYASSRKELIAMKNDYLEKIITDQMEAIRPVIKKYSNASSRDWVILSTITNTIPTTTGRVMRGEKPYRRASLLTQMLETKGGYKLA